MTVPNELAELAKRLNEEKSVLEKKDATISDLLFACETALAVLRPMSAQIIHPKGDELRRVIPSLEHHIAKAKGE